MNLRGYNQGERPRKRSGDNDRTLKYAVPFVDVFPHYVTWEPCVVESEQELGRKCTSEVDVQKLYSVLKRGKLVLTYDSIDFCGVSSA